jgi:hypothetical protein
VRIPTESGSSSNRLCERAETDRIVSLPADSRPKGDVRSMTRDLLRALFIAAAASPGCNRQEFTLPPPPPHGGTAYALPAGTGFVEVIRQEAPGQPGQTQLVIYFMDTECKPLRSAPTKAIFEPRGKKAAKIALAPTAESEPAKAGTLVSAPFADPGDLVGSLSATIDNKPLSIAISVR